MLERARSLSKMEHNLLKGELRELFVSTALRSFLTTQFGVGSGVVVNQRGDQSQQTDIIIYDNTILPPLIKAHHLGVYPAECVLATIEVKSNLTKNDIRATQGAAIRLHNEIYGAGASIYPEDKFPKPICAAFGFYGTGAKELTSEELGGRWLDHNSPNLTYLALANRFTWIKLKEYGWKVEPADSETGEEVKRFIAVLLDNVRTLSQRRSEVMAKHTAHKDYLSVYLREQSRS